MMQFIPQPVMKKVAVILTTVAAVLSLVACAPSAPLPLEGATLNGVAPGGFADQTVSTETPITVPVNTATRLPLNLPVENFVVLLEVDSGQATYDSNASQVEVTFLETGSKAIKITCSAPGYQEATYVWPVEVTLRSQPAVLFAVDGEGQTIQESMTLTAGESPVTLQLQGGAEDATLTLQAGDAQAVTATLEGGALTITPTKMGHDTIKVTATADGYYDEELTLEFDVLGTIDLSASKTQVAFTAGETASITISSQTPGMTFTATAPETVTLKQEGDKLTFVAEQEGSTTVTVEATALGYAPRILTIPVTVKAAPKVVKPTGGSLSVAPIDTSAYDAKIAEIIRYTNEERVAAGLSPLEHFTAVNTPAMIRAKEASAYWSHTRPDGSNFDTVFTQVGLKYRGVGENLYSGTGNATPREIVTAWMDSPGHRANILESKFNGIGIGVFQGSDGIYWVQLFAMK